MLRAREVYQSGTTFEAIKRGPDLAMGFTLLFHQTTSNWIVLECFDGAKERAEPRRMAGGSGAGNGCEYWTVPRAEKAKRPPQPAAEMEAAKLAAPAAKPSAHMARMDWCLPDAEGKVNIGAVRGILAPEREGNAQSPPAPPLSAAPTPAPAISQRHVDDLLQAAGVAPPDDQPLYWMRQEHRSDLARLLAETRLDHAALCAAVRSARAEGRKLGHTPRRVADIGTLLNGRGR